MNSEKHERMRGLDFDEVGICFMFKLKLNRCLITIRRHPLEIG